MVWTRKTATCQYLAVDSMKVGGGYHDQIAKNDDGSIMMIILE